MTNFSATWKNQFKSSVINIGQVYILIRIFLIWIAGGVIIPRYLQLTNKYHYYCHSLLPLVILQHGLDIRLHLAVALVQHVPLDVRLGGEPLALLSTPQTQVTLADLNIKSENNLQKKARLVQQLLPCPRFMAVCV